jgi:dihydroorotase
MKPGLPADITIFRVDEGEFELSDCYTQTRKAERQITPVTTYKNGKRFDADFSRGVSESNWFLQISEDEIPAGAAMLSDRQREFLATLASALSAVDWRLSSAERLDLNMALTLQEIFHKARAKNAISLREALLAVYDSFLERRFPMQVGLLLIRLDRKFAVERLRNVAGQRLVAA